MTFNTYQTYVANKHAAGDNITLQLEYVLSGSAFSAALAHFPQGDLSHKPARKHHHAEHHEEQGVVAHDGVDGWRRLNKGGDKEAENDANSHEKVGRPVWQVPAADEGTCWRGAPDLILGDPQPENG